MKIGMRRAQVPIVGEYGPEMGPGRAFPERTSQWRQDYQQAYFRNHNASDVPAYFYVEAIGKENGRRIVMHEFPKKDIPYAEDMGRRAIGFTVRGYFVVYPRDNPHPNGPGGLQMRDYRIGRDYLISHLEAEGPGTLQLPTLAPMVVVCERYRLSEEERLGGYCTFDMSFMELGAPPNRAVMDPRTNLVGAVEDVNRHIADSFNLVEGQPTNAELDRAIQDLESGYSRGAGATGRW